MKLFYPNLNFEDELAGRATQRAGKTHTTVRDLAAVMGFLGEPGDAVLMPFSDPLPDCLSKGGVSSITEADISSDCQLVPWGWSESAQRFALKAELSPDAIPPLDAVRMVNSRRFSAQFDQVVRDDSKLSATDLEPFGVLCHDMSEWHQAVVRLADRGHARWVAKPQHSHAGRNRLMTNGHNINREQQGWLSKHFLQSGAIYLEPWVERIDEAGLQFQITRKPGSDAASSRPSIAEIEFLGVTKLINDPVGRYVGSMIRADAVLSSQWRDAIRYGRMVCQSVADRGYFGPIGIDCFRFREQNGTVAMRLCNDVNARYTMGRIALSFLRWLRPDEAAVWLQLPSHRIPVFLSALKNSPGSVGRRDVRAVVTSPESVGLQPVKASTVLVMGMNADELLKLAESR